VEFYNEEIHGLSSPNIIRMITYRTRKVGNVWRRKEIRTVFWWRKPSGKNTVEELGVVRRITLKIFLNKSG